MLQCQYCLCSFPLRAVQRDPAARIPIQHRAHVHIVKSEMIVIPALEHFFSTFLRHPMSIVLHAKNQMTVLFLSRDRNTSAALAHLNAMLYGIFNERLQDQLRYIAAIDSCVHRQRNFQPPLIAALLDLQIGAEKGQLIRNGYIFFDARRSFPN